MEAVAHGDVIIQEICSPANIVLEKADVPAGSGGDNVNVYAVYPDYETGHEALIVMLKAICKYSPLTLRVAIKKI